jgi:hypothetical protein
MTRAHKVFKFVSRPLPVSLRLGVGVSKYGGMDVTALVYKDRVFLLFLDLNQAEQVPSVGVMPNGTFHRRSYGAMVDKQLARHSLGDGGRTLESHAHGVTSGRETRSSFPNHQFPIHFLSNLA